MIFFFLDEVVMFSFNFSVIIVIVVLVVVVLFFVIIMMVVIIERFMYVYRCKIYDDVFFIV